MVPSKNNAMNPLLPDLSRRAFLRQSCCAAVGTTGVLSALGQLRVMAALAGDGLPRTAAAVLPDYKALVCLYLQGGNDGTSLIVPTDPAAYTAYAAARSDLAVARDGLLPLAPKTYADGRSYGLHPSASGLHGLFTQGKVALLANVGTLVRPTTLADYKLGKNLPPQLYSHSDQSLQWQSGVPDKPFETGWGGRLADLLDAQNSNNEISMSISLNGANSFQRGKVIQPYAVNSGGVNSMNFFTSPTTTNGVFNARSNGFKSLIANPQDNALAAAFGSITKESISDGDLLGTALRSAPTLKTAFPSNNTAARLAMVAKLISISQGLGLRRQVFFVQLGGWDMHGSQASAYGPLLGELSTAMKAFYDATVELGVANQVTTFTASDFGRTYVPNAGGTDHGWGNQQMIMGGAVQGGNIYGKMPSLSVNADDDTGRGRWIPTTSVDEYNATLATWFGVSASNLSTVLPNIGRFAKSNLGFMA
jgi:uncharacterized protein (DUF1501 family)